MSAPLGPGPLTDTSILTSALGDKSGRLPTNLGEGMDETVAVPKKAYIPVCTLPSIRAHNYLLIPSLKSCSFILIKHAARRIYASSPEPLEDSPTIQLSVMMKSTDVHLASESFALSARISLLIARRNVGLTSCPHLPPD